MSKNLPQLQYELDQAKEVLGHVKAALAHAEYSGEYQFEFKEKLNEANYVHPGLKELIAACNQKQVYLQPDVVAQTVELECFDRMKKLVVAHVTGKSIPYLMTMKNELERQMLNDQAKGKEEKVAQLEAEIEALMPVSDDKLDEMVKGYTPGKEYEPMNDAEIIAPHHEAPKSKGKKK